MGRSDPPRAPRVRCVTRRRGASLRLEVGSQSLRQRAQVSCAIQDCRGGEEHRPGLHPSVLRLLFSGAWFRLEARTRAVLSRPRAHCAPEAKRFPPLGPASSFCACALVAPAGDLSLPQASGRAAGGASREGAGPELLSGGPTGISWFRRGGGGESRDRPDKAASRPGDRRGEWAGGSVTSRSAEGIGAPLPCNRSAAGRAASSSLGLPGSATPGPLVLGQAAARPPRPCGSGPK